MVKEIDLLYPIEKEQLLYIKYDILFKVFEDLQKEVQEYKDAKHLIALELIVKSLLRELKARKI